MQSPFDKKDASMTVMRSYYLFPTLTLLVGLAVGIFATGGFRKATEPAETSRTPDAAEAGNGSEGAESAGVSKEKPPTSAALSATAEESFPIAREDTEPVPEIETRLQDMNRARGQLLEELARLRERVEGLERRLVASAETPRTTGETAERPSRPEKPEDRRSALVAAGVAEERAADLLWRQGQQELDRLDLRDIATREGWFGSDRYREELGRIEENALDMRREIGEEFYDRYLFASGADNRVEVEAIIPGSAAEEAGLQPGDLVESYGDTRVFRFEDLNAASTEGERGELVPVGIRRGKDIVEAWLPRGPLGVRIDRARVDPDA